MKSMLKYMTTTYNQAKRLKELGYGLQWTTFLYEISTKDMHNAYAPLIQCQRSDLFIKAPTVSDALQWIREKYKIVCAVDVDYYDGFYHTGKWTDRVINKFEYTNSFDEHNEAESALLDELLTYLEQKR